MKIISYIFIIILLFTFRQGYPQSNDSLKTVVAGKGDGIYKILRENGYIVNEHYNNFLELNKEKIGEGNSLIEGEIYFLPLILIPVTPQGFVQETDKDSITEPENIEIEKNNLQFADTVIDNKLQNALIYLISGHGGPDPGATAYVNGHLISEDEYAYDICMRIAKNIEEHGGMVYMIINDPDDGIRDDMYLKLDYDEYCYPDLDIPKNQTERLKQRADAVNLLYDKHKDVKYQRVVEIHLDSRTNGTKLDVFFYHYDKSESGKKFAETMQKVFDEKYLKHQPNRGYGGTVSPRNLYVIRKVIPVALFIELGNIQNERDRKRFLTSNNRQALANWITEGIIEDFSNQ